jgi:hypothetical protein
MRTTEVQLRLDAGRIVPGDLLSRFSISLATGTRSTSTPTNLPNAGDVAARKTTSHSNRMATPSCYGSMWPVYPVRTDDANGLDVPLVAHTNRTSDDDRSSVAVGIKTGRLRGPTSKIGT